MKPWQKKAWKEKREEVLRERDRCEHCGSQKNLVVHHKMRMIPYRHHIRLIRRQVLQEKIEAGEFEATTTKKITCPECRTRNNAHIYARKRKKPEYRCLNCRSEFAEPSYMDTGKLTRENWKKFIGLYGEEIERRLEQEREPFFEDYERLKPNDIEVVCNRCHYALRKGMDLCPGCRTNYKQKRYDVCFECTQAAARQSFFAQMD